MENVYSITLGNLINDRGIRISEMERKALEMKEELTVSYNQS